MTLANMALIELETQLKAANARINELTNEVRRAGDLLIKAHEQRDQWHKIADERAAELIRLSVELSKLRQPAKEG